MLNRFRPLGAALALGLTLSGCAPVAPVSDAGANPPPEASTAVAQQPTPTPALATFTATVEVPTPTPMLATPTPQPVTGEPLVIAGEYLLRPEATPEALAPVGDPPGLYGVVAAPDGSALAYAAMQAGRLQLWLRDLRSGTATPMPADAGDAFARAAFAPDGSALAYTLIGQERWQLLIYDRAGDAARAVAEGPLQVSAETLPMPLVPIAWTPRGLLVEQILYATDALPRGLALLDPTTGEVQTLRAGEHIQAVPSSDGAHAALVVGQLPPGGQPVAAIARYDLDNGTERELLPQQQAMIPALAWSPDGARLAYAAAPGYQSSESVLGVLDTDGANLRTLELARAAAGYRFLDLAWADPATLLVLVGDTTGQIELRRLDLERFEAGAFNSVATWSLPAPPQQSPRIVYVPR
ncbi:LpqB family beta-propeller domain-containing protein [Kallotenue papyrolyticum]|uniref:LpqB family beta-propeller domain-containing protein n=1 Tax=Kallotenue papyrolyticum TaxID=1325125 RepID=UPI000492A2C3|nr:LpqB family beta-propeller domain-containing protein [Kallotenue papyrolyticum]